MTDSTEPKYWYLEGVPHTTHSLVPNACGVANSENMQVIPAMNGERFGEAYLGIRDIQANLPPYRQGGMAKELLFRFSCIIKSISWKCSKHMSGCGGLRVAASRSGNRTRGVGQVEFQLDRPSARCFPRSAGARTEELWDNEGDILITDISFIYLFPKSR